MLPVRSFQCYTVASLLFVFRLVAFPCSLPYSETLGITGTYAKAFHPFQQSRRVESSDSFSVKGKLDQSLDFRRNILTKDGSEGRKHHHLQKGGSLKKASRNRLLGLPSFLGKTRSDLNIGRQQKVNRLLFKSKISFVRSRVKTAVM